MADTVQQHSPFLKQLASSNSQTRRDALDSLRIYLSRRSKFTDIELLKLWKGLFYCMWMSDRPVAQQRLARDLASIVDTNLAEENVLPFLNAFWKTISGEWRGIDALRMDKFLFLVRQQFAAGLRFCAQNKWEDERRIKGYLEILQQTPLNIEIGKVPDGLRYHTMDIYIDELDKVDVLEPSKDGQPRRTGKAPMEMILSPLKRMQKEGPMKSLRTRATDALDDARLEDWDAFDQIEAPDADEEWAGFGD